MSTTTPPDSLKQNLLSEINAADNLDALEKIRVAALGKKGSVSALLKSLSTMDAAARQQQSPILNALKTEITAAILAKKNLLADAALTASLKKQSLDMSLPPQPDPQLAGRVHPVSQTLDELIAIFTDLDFDVADGPEIEREYYNFTALNIPPAHPARQMHDTFYLHNTNAQNKDDGYVLRTHTSPVQIRAMEAGSPPFRLVAPGRVYRCDSDQTHTPMFHQIEGLVIDKHIHLGHLKWVLEVFLAKFFAVENLSLRFRPSYFPFTEPSLEVDIAFHTDAGRIIIGETDDGKSEWMEIGGCGMVHPAVLAAAKVASGYQGFAFGMGIDRLAMIKYGMDDLRAFFDGDMRWLKHYGFLPFDVPSLAGGLASGLVGK